MCYYLLVMMDKIYKRLDKAPLWVIGFLLAAVVFAPYVIMGSKSVFVWHDQLDETILHYVFTARHMGEGLKVFPEMMGGLSSSAFQPNAYLFVPLFRLFNPLVAFVLSYFLVFSMAFFGMYFLVKEHTSHSIVSLICAGLFAMLPFYPVYGGAVAGVPMAAYAITLLCRKKKLLLAYVLLCVYALTSHLILSGYAVLGLWGLLLLYRFIKKSLGKFEVIGFFGVIALYVLLNLDLFVESLSSKDGFVSHRTEFVIYPSDFIASLKEVFLSGSMHAESYHMYLIVPIVVLLVIGIVRGVFGSLQDGQKGLLSVALAELVTIVLISLLFAFWNGSVVTAWKNSQTGMLKSFQLDRFYWLLPALWYSLLGLAIAVNLDDNKYDWVKCLIMVVVLVPTIVVLKNNSLFYMSINQMNNGSNVTGYIPWESYYSEDVMAEIDESIGLDKSSYRVAHIGMNPTPALMHGFYTVDGYSNSYPLSYKHAFREVMAEELAMADPQVASYFDTWGSRCYLFNSQSGITFMNGNKSEVKYNDLRYDYDKLAALGCKYIFSCGEILDYADESLRFVGEFTSDTSYWDVWVYELP